MNKIKFKKHLNKLKQLRDQNVELSLYDLKAGIFAEEMSKNEVTIAELIKHKFSSRVRIDGKFVKLDKHDRAYDYVIGVDRYPYDRNTIEIIVATVYITTHPKIKEDNKESYRDNPMYDRRYGIYKIELRAITYNKLHPDNGHTITQYKEV